MFAQRHIAAPLFAAALWLSPNAAFDNYPRQRGVDVEGYVFAITLRDDSSVITADATVTVRFVERGITGLWLELANESGNTGMRVDGVASGGAPVRFTHATDRIDADLAERASAGGPAHVRHPLSWDSRQRTSHRT